MANKRILKKNVNDVVNDVIEETFSYMLYNPGKKDKEAEEIIDAAVECRDNLIGRVNAKPEGKSKAHFNDIKTDLEKNAIDLITKINALG